MRQAIPFVAFFLSGAASLIAEVCWIRQASLIFGSTSLALSSVLAVFFLGLASGSFLFGQASVRTSRPLRLYALLEIGVAALVLASPAAFEVAESLYGRFYRAAGAASGGPGGATWVARLLLVAAVLLPPTVLMGGTLPLFCRQFVQGRTRIGATVGLLYGLNTLGAAAGCAAAGFVLLPALGLQHTLQVGALLSVLAATVALAVRSVPLAPASTLVERGTASPVRRHAIVVGLFFATGFVALGHEVIWTRFLALVVRTTVTTYTLSLCVVLLGIVLGSWLAASFADRVAGRARLFGSLQVMAALVMLATLLLPPRVWRVHDSTAWTCFALALGPAVLSGALLPLAVRMVVDDPAFAGRATGLMTAVNTLGGIAGSLCVGFLALPQLGLQGSLLLTTGVGIAAGCTALLVLGGRGRFKLCAVAVVVCIAAWLTIPRLLRTRLPADFLAEPQVLVDYLEGRESNLAVVRKQRALQLEVDRWWQGQDRKTHQIMAAHIPMLLHSNPKRILVVGVGAGQTPERILLYDVEKLDCVDIEPAVFDLVRRHYPSAWMRDERVQLRREDGRNYILHTGARYDLISLEVGQIFRPGAESFYTADFYRRAGARLEPGGLVSQFVPLAFLTPETFKRIIASFVEVFPASVLWYNTSELLLLGTTADRFVLDPARLRLLDSNPAIHADLSWSQWGGEDAWLHHPHVFLGGFLCGQVGLGMLARDAPLLRDDHPALAYATRAANDQQANELPILDLLRPRLEPVAGILGSALPDSTLAAAAKLRDRNLGDMVASALLRRVDALKAAGRQAELEALLRDALRANPTSVQANRIMADHLLLRGRPAEALPFYERALALSPRDAASNIGLALLLHAQRRPTEAVARYRIGLESDPHDAEAYNSLAGALVEMGDLNGAVREFQAALRVRPDYAHARDNLARVQAYLATQGRSAPQAGTAP